MSFFSSDVTSRPAGNGAGGGAPSSDIMHISEIPMADRITPAQRLTAVGVGLVGVVGAAITYTCIRWIGKRAHPMLSVNYFAAWTTLISVLVLQFHPRIDFRMPSGSREWGLLFSLGICGFLMQILLTAGLQQESSSRPTNMIYTQMLFAVFFDKLVWNSTLGVWSIIGSTIVLGSAIYVALQHRSRMSRVLDIEDPEEEEQSLLVEDGSWSVDSGQEYHGELGMVGT